MLKPVKLPYLILFVCHFLLALIAFKDFRLDPDEIIFNTDGDGIKNYYTLLAYVKESPSQESAFKLDFFNYPFGEYVYTADNTPLFAVPFKWVCHHVIDVSDHTLAIYNGFIILSVIFSGLLCFAVLRRIIGANLISLLLSIILPWTNVQLLRIWRGHFNLSFAFLILLAILLGILWYEQRKNPRQQLLTGTWMILLIWAGFMLHGYYLAIVGAFIAALLFFQGIYQFRLPEGKRSLVAALLVPGLAAACSIGTLMASDGFYNLREAAAGGYDWMEHKVRFWSMLNAYDFINLPFPVFSLQTSYDAENMGYLGTFGLFTALGLLLLAIAHKRYRNLLKTHQKEFFSSPLTGAIFFASLLMLIVNFGEHYYTKDLNSGFRINNFLNPLFLLHQFTDTVEQFRSLGRFFWPFFWGFNIWVAWSLMKIFPELTRGLRITAIAILILLGGSEVRDFLDAFQSKASHKNPLSQNNFPDFGRLNIDFSQYQALVALPYYNVGSEKRELILDDYDPNGIFSYQLALHSKLPMMNVKLSRTVPQQAIMLEDFLARDTVHPELAAKLNRKPILVFLDRAALDNHSWPSMPGNDRPAARETHWQTLDLPRRRDLPVIDSLGDYIFYHWDLQKP